MDDLGVMNKLHFIIDSTGKYYRVNGNNQLVIAKDRNDAGVFSFMEANQRIGSGKKAHFYTTIPVEEDEAEEQEKASAFVLHMPVKQEDKAEMTYDLSEVDWLEYLRHFIYMSSNLNNYAEELKQKLSEEDLEICDILHLLELYELSDEESLRVVDILKEHRVHRREIKDDMCRVDYFQKAIGTSNNVAKAKEAVKRLEKLEHRKYTPRRLPELFEGMEIRKRACSERTDISKKMEDGDTWEQATYTQEESADRSVQMESEVAMEYIKKETAFDNGEMDWQQFAQQQVNFFTDARQRMINLNIELDELEEDIENMLLLVEDANYNVAQGYKVFKELKELRNTRKEKLKELKCLDALTAAFDCESMLAAYQGSLERIEEIEEAFCGRKEAEYRAG